MPSNPRLAVIGGSGLYELSELENEQVFDITTPFGKPSAPIVVGKVGQQPIAFLARHGIGHSISPSEINFRANIHALKTLGVERIISVSACGSLREDYAPRDIVIPDQLFDFTKDRTRSFFGEGIVSHISVAKPFCEDFSNILFASVAETGAIVHKGGSFITIEGPRFSTQVESNVYRSWGMSIIGMTTSPEAFLAKEAEMCYAVMAHVTDYDVWHVSEEPVTVEMVIEILEQNTETAKRAILNVIQSLPGTRECECEHALANSLITNPNQIPPETRARLDLLVNKYLE
jgi:5'-methylthioadenosine phosphorylase